jgi:hypothetical protein
MLEQRPGLSRCGYRNPRRQVRVPKLQLPAGASAQTGILASAARADLVPGPSTPGANTGYVARWH